ncbi:MAG: hypothetical protein A2Y38_01715 [Spirochaetes bacterium GWB1_59_5]|nr:MAG: hypothetical protein A2Y38_01715 [Spirochaetes bacterium GWB1_59_5]
MSNGAGAVEKGAEFVERFLESTRAARAEIEANLAELRHVRARAESAERNAEYALNSLRLAQELADVGILDEAGAHLKDANGAIRSMLGHAREVEARMRQIPTALPGPAPDWILFDLGYRMREGAPEARELIRAPGYMDAVQMLLNRHPQALHIRPRRYQRPGEGWTALRRPSTARV